MCGLSSFLVHYARTKNRCSSDSAPACVCQYGTVRHVPTSSPIVLRSQQASRYLLDKPKEKVYHFYKDSFFCLSGYVKINATTLLSLIINECKITLLLAKGFVI